MSPREIFVSALDIDDAVQRRAYLDVQCAGNEELRQEIDGLLRAHDDAGSFLERSPVDCMDATILNDDGSNPNREPDGTSTDAPDAPVQLCAFPPLQATLQSRAACSGFASNTASPRLK